MKNAVVNLNSDGHVLVTRSAATRAVGLWAVVPLVVLLAISTARAGTPIYISSISDPSVSLQIRADGEANHGTRLMVVSNCLSGNTECLWTLLPNGMIISNSDPKLAWNAYGGAREGADVTLVRGCQPSLTDCTWTVRSDGLIVSNTNPQLAVNAYGGAKDRAPLKLVNNCAPELDGCKWMTIPSVPQQASVLAGEWVLNHNGYWSILTITFDPRNLEKFTGLIHVTSRRAPDTRIIKGTIAPGARVDFWRTLLDGSTQHFDGFLMYKTESNVTVLTQMAGTFTRQKDGTLVEPAGWFACKREYCNPWIIVNPGQ